MPISSLLLQLLYITFLAEFFADTDSDLDDLYYSEMHEAGVFESLSHPDDQW